MNCLPSIILFMLLTAANPWEPYASKKKHPVVPESEVYGLVLVTAAYAATAWWVRRKTRQ